MATIRRIAPAADALICQEFIVYARSMRTVCLRKLHRDHGSDWALTVAVRLSRAEARAQWLARKAEGWVEIPV